MAPPSNKIQPTPRSTETASDAAYAEGQRKLKEWTAKLYNALNDSEGYGEVHRGFLKDFENLSDQVRGSTKRSIIPYIESVFNHTASQGYQHDVHYDPLFQGMSAYCRQLPPPTWVPPPDQYDKSPTPTLPPLPAPPSIKKKNQSQPVPGAGTSSTPIGPPAAKSRGKAGPKDKSQKDLVSTQNKPIPKSKAPQKPKLSKEFVEDTSDGEYKAGDSDEANAESKPVNRELVKCTGCEKDGSPCLVNPATVGSKSSPACYECFSSKRKCSLYKRSTEGRKRKAVAVAPGAMGELSGKLFGFSLYLPNVLLVEFGIPKDLLERFERYETEANTSREELRELSQEVAALRAENNSVRRFCADRLCHVYETLGARDSETIEAFRSLASIHHEEHSLNAHLREAMEKVEALLGHPLSYALDPTNAASPLLVDPPLSAHGDESNTAGTEFTEAPTHIPAVQAPGKRDTSSRPADLEVPPKRPKL